MCDKELLLGYLYDELPASDRQAFDRHLASCADCRDEVSGLRGTRTHLTSWAPPEPDLGFEIVRSAEAGAGTVVAHVAGLGSGGGGRPDAGSGCGDRQHRNQGRRRRRRRPDRLESTCTGRAVADRSQSTAVTATDLGALQQRLEARVKELEGQLAARRRQSHLYP